MPIENPLPPFWEWFAGTSSQWGAGLLWLAIVASLVGFALVAGYLLVALRYGPVEGLKIVGRLLASAFGDLTRISPRRVGALAWLAVMESIRRRVVIVFAVFLLILLFAGWFLDAGNIDPARLYLSFVLTATSYLVLLLALFLSVFSLPNDLKARTLHTIVTKPVRPSEIILGRMLGFTIIGTALLGFMSVVSYFFVVRGLDHVHALDAAQLQTAAASADGKSQLAAPYTGETQRHRHRVAVLPSGEVYLDAERGHTHPLSVSGEGDSAVYSVGGPDGMLQARVPVYGGLRFRDAKGIDTDKGINVGDEWMYRSFIQGASPAAAVWTFRNVTEDRFPNGLPLETSFEVFRTFKANIEKGVLGSISLRNPRTGLTTEVRIFHAKDFAITSMEIPRTIVNPSRAQMIARRVESPQGQELIPSQMDESLDDKKEFDLFGDLVADGEVEVWLQCLDASQYFGASQADLYLRARDASFAANFFKGYLGIWLQMVLVISFGVLFSTFLSGPVAMVATAGAMVAGFFSDFMAKLGSGNVLGGGPFESLIRLVSQENMMTDLTPGLTTDLAKWADQGAAFAMKVISAVLPPLGDFSYANWVAYGFDVPWSPYVAIPSLHTLAYVLPVFVAAYLFLKTREVAR